MPTKQIDRLVFAQGGLCFFCKQSLHKNDASVEHLVASANGGSNSDENCVVCCKAINALLGSMSLKEKVQVVLNQKGQFKCPNGGGASKAAPAPKTKKAKKKAPKKDDDSLSLVIADLKKRGLARPRKIKTLTSTIVALFPNGLSESEVNALIQQMQSEGKIKITDNKVTYEL